MTDSRKQKLIDLGAAGLAEALLELSIHSDEINDLIERLVATPAENVQRFRKKLADLKRSTRHVDWREASSFARELVILLQDLKAGVEDPLTGVKLVVEFFEADATIFEMCDDSYGDMGDVFRYDAKGLFVEYASHCTDKEDIARIILKANQEDNSGIRNVLIDCAGECLPREVIQTMIATLQKQADNQEDLRSRRQLLILIESLARQNKDGQLFEKTRIALQEKLSTAGHIDIARVYLESGDVETAHSWLKKLPSNETHREYRLEELLEEIYRRQNDSVNLTKLLYRQFRSRHSTNTLQKLLDVIGHDKRDEVLNDEVGLIVKTDTLNLSDAEFLIEIGELDDAETYLLKRAKQLNGNYYSSLLSIVEVMEAANRHLLSSLIYRSLLVSILEDGHTKAYPHGVQYLKKLDRLSAYVTDWKEHVHHEAFNSQIIKTHGRKRSFWSQYKENN